ncbi:MAG TPA: hypothetical protein PK605_05850 [Ignavibacteria bacterium]|nr:hypothetical protein [Bacteroidota bacterium]HRE09584.1 hypothetical protein [Ignavibacteria bacterium]HRF64397.1 hypothetical protein [Ignavibacteria bacterium]HRJ03910.1 hypothetical protein [Ignavibacteria bacterium]HRJ86854.1 hypothetical protein [Ignavibacteria bacterium]
MINTSVISILKTLTKQEIKEFDKFIISPFFNNQPSLTNFYEELKKHYPDFSAKAVDRKAVFEKLYTGRVYSDEVIRRLTSDLKKLLDDFMYNKVLESNPVEARYLRSFEYSRRGLFKEAEKELDRILNRIGSNGPMSSEYVQNRLDYEDRLVQIKLSTNRQSEISPNFINEVEYLIYHFILRLSYYLHNVRVNKVIFNVSESKFMNDFIASVDLSKIDKLIALDNMSDNVKKAMRVYVLFILNNFYESNETYFDELKAILPDAIGYFQEHEKYNIYQMTEAICWQKMVVINRERYRRELFEINKLRLEAGVFLPDGRTMRFMLFRQILMTALQLKETGWAERFVRDYSDYLPEIIRGNLKLFAEAHLLFEKHRFEESLAILNRIDFDVFTLKFDIRNLMMRIFIELNYIEEAISLLDSYKHFISKNKGVSEYYRSITESFLKYCKNLIDLKTGKSRLKPDEVLNELEKDNDVNFRSWLKEKLTGPEK